MSVQSILLLSLICACSCARILVYLTSPYRTHHATFQNLWKELSLRGHQLTIITKFPMNDQSLTNISEIYVKRIDDEMIDNFLHNVCDDYTGSIMEAIKIFTVANRNDIMNPKVQQLINNKNNTFDLFIFEAQILFPLVLSWVFKCPSIGVSSLDAILHIGYYVGNPIHPIVKPDINMPVVDYERLSFVERATQVFYHCAHMLVFNYLGLPAEQRLAVELFGDEVPDLKLLARNISLLLLVTNPIFTNVSPLYGHTVSIGNGIHFDKPKPLTAVSFHFILC